VDDNIKTDVRGTGLDDMDWIYMAENRCQWNYLVKTVMNPQVP
jgi:hypothetical protein